MKKRFGRGQLALCALLACTTAHTAHAEGRFFYFGDSLSDNGRLSRLIGSSPSAAAGFVGGRSTNGPTWAEQLPDFVGLEYEEDYGYAYGGATSRNGGLTETFFPTPNPTGYLHQITQFEGTNITLTEDDVVGIWIGHNDIHPVAAVSGDADATAQDVISNTIAGIDRLIARGAKRIVLLNVYDIGIFDAGLFYNYPNFNRADATSMAVQINAGLDQIERDGIIIHQLDTFELLRRVQADPAAYGFTIADAANHCVANGCGALTLEEQNQFVFMDGVHFTTGYSELVADYASKLLLAASATRAGTQSGLTTVDSFQQGILSQFGLNGSNWINGDGFSSYVDATVLSSNDQVSSIGATESDTTLTGLTFGGKFDVSDTVSFGLVGNLSRSNTDLGDDLGSNDLNAGQIAGLISIDQGAFYSNIGVSFGAGSMDFERSGVISDLDADADISAYGVFAEVGYLYDVGAQGWQIGPVASARFTDLTVDGYTESGDDLLAITVEEQSQSQTRASLGLGFQNAATSGSNMSLNGVIALEYGKREFDDLTYYQASNPSRAIVEEGGSSDDFYVRFGMNAGFDMNANTSAYVGINGTAGRASGNELGLRGGISIRF